MIKNLNNKTDFEICINIYGHYFYTENSSSIFIFQKHSIQEYRYCRCSTILI